MRKLAIDLEQDIQDLVPLWLQERIEQEETKLQLSGKRDAKRKP